MKNKLKINKGILKELKKTSSLLCNFLDHDAFMGGPIEEGGKIERTLNNAILMIKNEVKNENNRST